MVSHVRFNCCCCWVYGFLFVCVCEEHGSRPTPYLMCLEIKSFGDRCFTNQIDFAWLALLLLSIGLQFHSQDCMRGTDMTRKNQQIVYLPAWKWSDCVCAPCSFRTYLAEDTPTVKEAFTTELLSWTHTHSHTPSPIHQGTNSFCFCRARIGEAKEALLEKGCGVFPFQKSPGSLEETFLSWKGAHDTSHFTTLTYLRSDSEHIDKTDNSEAQGTGPCIVGNIPSRHLL